MDQQFDEWWNNNLSSVCKTDALLTFEQLKKLCRVCFNEGRRVYQSEFDSIAVKSKQTYLDVN